MISDADIAAVTAAARSIPPAEGTYLEDDFVTSLLSTVVDYQTHTTAVVKAMQHYQTNRWDDIRTIDDLAKTFDRFQPDQEGNTQLAQHLWGYNMWTRAQQLRELTAFFQSIGVVDLPHLKEWAAKSDFKRDFQGKVKGLGIAVYHWLVMRMGVDTVKPDVHVRRFAENAVRRRLGDEDVVAVVVGAAHALGLKAYELDWAIWEASRGGLV